MGKEANDENTLFRTPPPRSFAFVKCVAQNYVHHALKNVQIIAPQNRLNPSLIHIIYSG